MPMLMLPKTEAEKEVEGLLEEVEAELNDLRIQENEIMERRRELKTKLRLEYCKRKVEEHETHNAQYPGWCQREIDSLVRIGETCDEWAARKPAALEWAHPGWKWDGFHRFQGKTGGHYTTWLIELKDERVKGTELYRQKWNP